MKRYKISEEKKKVDFAIIYIYLIIIIIVFIIIIIITIVEEVPVNKRKG